MLEQISKGHHDLIAIKKYTTRPPRHNETISTACDLHFLCAESDIKKMEIHYQFKEHWYGIDLSEIESVLEAGKYPCLIIRDYPVLIKLRRTYGKRSLTFYIQGAYSCCCDLGLLLRNQGRSENDIQAALDTNKTNFDEYYYHMTQDMFDDIHLFDAFIINYYDEKFLGQFEYHLKVDKKGKSIEERVR